MTTIDRQDLRPLLSGAPDTLADRAGIFLVVLALLGATFGALTAMTRHGVGPAAHVVSQIMDSGWAWLLAGLLACWGGQTYGLAAVRGVVFIAAAVVGNYVSDALSVVYTSRAYAPLDSTAPAPAPRLEWSLLDLSFWLLIAMLAGLMLAAVAIAVRRGGVRLVAAAHRSRRARRAPAPESAGERFRPSRFARGGHPGAFGPKTGQPEA